ncbi:MAG: DMT family transporter [Actinomycetota bacterium]
MTERPTPATLVAFALVAIIGGSNFVAVRLSNRELEPFYGAGLRFAAAALLLFVLVLVKKTPIPRGSGLVGSLVFGVMNFFAAYAFVYWGLQRVPAALAGVVFATVPLMTLILAVLQRVERFRWRAVLGAAIAIGGVSVMAGSPDNADVPILYFLAVVVSALGAAEAAVVIKRFPTVHPFAMNAIAMAAGAPILFALSALTGERWIVPSSATTWYTLAFLVPVGSVALFVLYVFVVQRWTPSAASYQFVLFPVVAALVGSIVADEPLDVTVAIGGALVIAGTYVGALARTKAADQLSGVS